MKKYKHLQQLTGWSDTIFEAISSEEEAMIYIKAGLIEKVVNGRRCLINPNIQGKDYNCHYEWLRNYWKGFEEWKNCNNADLMGEGYAPLDENGDAYHLHHIGQKQDSPFAELTYWQHMDGGNNSILHPKRETEIDRQIYVKEKELHWRTRYNYFPDAYESKLYTDISITEKYTILEDMRKKLEYLYREDRPTYDHYRAALKPNTWDALEENWKLWDPVPKSHVVWEGPNDCTCRLKPSHPNYKDCEAVNFTVCQYDLHGSPNFDAVTFPGSIVDISDLYDTLSADNIQKRGGGPNSLQEIAQNRMIPTLKPAIEAWAKTKGSEPDFWQWRDSLNLVPHEDTDCRTMRLVYRSAHTAFKHRGGVANALNIKSHFSN